MAGNQDGVASASAAVAEVRLDANGQPLSKNALKKLLKKEAAEKKKAEKAAARVRSITSGLYSTCVVFSIAMT